MTNKAKNAAKHTLAPWIATYRAQCGPGTQLTEWAVWPQKDGEARVCSLVDGSRAEANAHLIAAAPDLLEAAKRYLYQMESEGPGIGNLYPAYRTALRAAIAKAEMR